MGDPVVMSNEQFRALLSSMKEILQVPAANPPADTNTAAVSTNQSSFATCKSRFAGTSEEDVEAFINAITIFKECVNMPDDRALKGLPMLLDKLAGVWWQGVKSTVADWDQALKALRHAFGHVKPPHKIYRELFSKPQGEGELTDVFVSNARALLSHLPAQPVLDDKHKLDMIYGLLHQRIRSRVPRDDISDFEELVKKARSVEDSLTETNRSERVTQSEKTASMDKNKKLRPKCTFCNCFGHLQQECRKFLAKNSSSQAASINPSETAATLGKEERKPTTISCFGCGKPGFVRSNCPSCKASAKPSTSALEFCFNTVAESCEYQQRPLIQIGIAGSKGLACIDTGAKSSMAGGVLSDLLLSKNVPYTEQEVGMTLADGIARQVKSYRFNLEIALMDRVIPLALLSVPEHRDSRTLLGVDFIKAANLVLDLPNGRWSFGDLPDCHYYFEDEPSHSIKHSIATLQVEDLSLRPDEGIMLSAEERVQVDKLIDDHADIFKPSKEPTPFAEHVIRLTDERPIAVPPYRLSPAKKDFLRNEIDRLLQEDIIEECESPYAAPVVLVPKKTGSYRLCVDYRRLNEVTVPDNYPLPRIDDLLHAASGTVYMTTLDLRAGYWQVSVKCEDRDKTAFVSPFGTYRFTRLPFGLRTAPATFQRLIDRFRAGLPGVELLAYLDDLICLSPDFDTHLRDLKNVFNRLRLFRLSVNRTKCRIASSEVKYLGHVLTPQGFFPDPEKCRAILSMPQPRNSREVQSFLQTASWFRRFVPNFSQIAKPLSDLTKKKTPWAWGEAQQEAFDLLKGALTSPPILRQADVRQPFVLRTDASSYALGAALLQGEGEDERPVEYASKLLTSAQRNYSTVEREALAVVWAVEKFRGYLEGSQVVVKSDHQPLRWLFSLKSPSGRLARWALTLQSYDLRVEYTPGRSNVIADMLSRPPQLEIEKDDLECNSVTIDFPTLSAAEFRSKQLEDPDVKKIIDCFENPDRNFLDHTRWTDRGYLMNNGLLYRYSPDQDHEEAQLVVPQGYVPEVIQKYHDDVLAGHYGIDKTYERIAQRYFWPGMRRTIADHVKKCLKCQRYKPTNLKPSGLLQTPVKSQRFEVLSIDLFGPLPETPKKERWIFIIEDVSTKWVELFALQAASAEACARCLVDEVLLRYGCCRRVISDNGTQFVSEVMQQVAHCLDFKQNLVPVYHPEANPVERRNRDLKTQLSILVEGSHDRWSDQLPSIRFAMNTAKCQATDFTPAYLMFARELRTPDDVHRDLRSIVSQETFLPQITPYLKTMSKTLAHAREVHEGRQDSAKEYADQKRREGPEYSVGDKVLVQVHALSKAAQSYTSKFAPRRDGPYQVRKRISPTTYQVASLQDPETPVGVYHVSALTPFIADEAVDPAPVRPIRSRGRPRTCADCPGCLQPKPSSKFLDHSRGRSRDPKGEDVTSTRKPPGNTANRGGRKGNPRR